MELFEQQALFISGQGGYVRYRIPALVVSRQGSILAFCEARKFTGRDSDQIDLFLRRSHDGGRTFDQVQVVATEEGWVCGNPAPVLDRDTGVIWLPFCKNLADGDQDLICQGLAPRTVWLTHSDDEGATWAEPVEITQDAKGANWSWVATGPGHGIQARSGCLVIPCDHTILGDRGRQDPCHAHVLTSDDHGATWRVGGSADEGTGESTAVETSDGWLYLNCRNKYSLPEGGNHRCVAWRRDDGASFSPVVHDAALLEPLCQASVCRLSSETEGQPNRLLFSNPASRTRDHLTVRLSVDEGRTWPVSRLLHQGPAAYSDLCVAPDGTICCLYERGRVGPYEEIALARFNLEWLTEEREGLER